MAPTPPVPAEFLAQYDAERARKLRRRVLLFCVLILVLASYDLVVLAIDRLMPGYLLEEDRPTRVDLVFDGLLWALFGGMLVYLLRVRCTRARVVRASQLLVAASGVAIMLFMPHVLRTGVDPVPRTPDGDWTVAAGGLGTVFLMHVIASTLVALSPREGLIPLAPIYAVFAGWVALGSVAPMEQRLAMLALSPVAALPGFSWSWWRYRSFADRFRARAVQRRYAEVSSELTQARRVHEALFPPAITRGPVRMAYTYEPMRDIGGDFLFVRPLSFPPSSPVGPVLVVLVDVTGHGIAAALAVNRLHAELERLTMEGPLPEPGVVMSGLNRFVGASLAPQGIYATGVCLRVTPPVAGGREGVLEWSGAGHPPALVRSRDGSVHRLESGAPMLGVVDDELFGCGQERWPLGIGERVVAYTDGAFEASDGRGRELGIDGVEALVRSAPVGVGLAEGVRAGVSAFRAGEAGDDVLVVEVGLADGGDAPG